MSPREAWWRAGSKLRGSVDRVASPRWGRSVRLSRIAEGNGDAFAIRTGTLGHPLADSSTAAISTEHSRWWSALIEQAERIYQNRLTFFDLEDHDLGPEIQWNYEYAAKRPAPLRHAPSIDYRDYAVTGDAKVVWEPNRHQHLGVLGRAYRISGDHHYAEKVVEQIDSWIRQCPYGRGMNWRSPLEMAIRVINWVWALELIAPSRVQTLQQRRQLLPVVYRHLWDISRKYSGYSSANNHLVGEAAGVFIASSYFRSLRQARAWEEQSRKILLREIACQTHSDGGHRELSMGYHLFVLEFFLLAGLVARNSARDFPREYWQRLEKMFEYLAAFTAGGESLPMFGDCDDGYVLNLGDWHSRASGLLAVGATLFERSDFKALSGGFSEPAFWLLGNRGYEAFQRLDDSGQPDAIQSQALPASGYYVLQSGRRGGSDRISVTFDCGALGFGSIAAHGHADALSFTLRAFGTDIIVDPGTYDYFTCPRWRDYFRSTRAHNTIVVDDLDQSEMLGPFLWGRRATARCLRWRPSPDGGTVTGEHDGYTRLAAPVVHRRTITLDGDKSELTVRDELMGTGRHQAKMYLHLAEHCQVHQAGPSHFKVDCGGGSVDIRTDPSLSVLLFRGSVEPILGWVSRGYHRKKPSTTLVARCQWTGSLTSVTRIAIGEARS